MNSMELLIDKLNGYKTDLNDNIKDQIILDQINILVTKLQINKLNSINNVIDLFNYSKSISYNTLLLKNISTYLFDVTIYNEQLSKSFFKELKTKETAFNNEMKNFVFPKLDSINDISYEDDTINSVNDIFLNSFVTEDCDIVNIMKYSGSRYKLSNLVISDYVEYMNKAININELLVNMIRETNIDLLFNCQSKVDTKKISVFNDAIQSYNFIPIKYSKHMNELFGLPNSLSKDAVAKTLSKKYNVNICIIIDNISGNDIEYKIPFGKIDNIYINTKFINQTKTLLYEYFKPNSNKYKRSTELINHTDKSKYIFIRKCESAKYALLSNDLSKNNFIIEHHHLEKFLSNNISNRIHCYYKQENLIRSKIFDPEVLMEMNYNIKFVPEVIKENDFLLFIKSYLDKKNNVDELEKTINNYFYKLFKNDKYILNEMKPIINYLLRGDIRMMKRDVFNEKNIDNDKLKKLVLAYYEDGKFIDKIITRYNIIYSNRKDRDIFVYVDN